jgi:hypothetical protein
MRECGEQSWNKRRPGEAQPYGEAGEATEDVVEAADLGGRTIRGLVEPGQIFDQLGAACC